MDSEISKDDYNKEFKNSFRKIALPVGIQNLFFISLNFVDSLMVGQLGQAQYNAVGLGGQFYFLVNLMLVGVSAALSIYMAQYFGNNDLKGYRKSVGLAIITCFVIGFVAGLMSILFPQFIISRFTDVAEIQKYGVQYLRIIGFQIPMLSVIMPLAVASRTSNNAKLPLAISSVTLSANVILNYILIFGKLGLPALSVRGAAYATLLSSMLSLILYISIITFGNSPLHGPIKEFLNITKGFIKKVAKTGWTIVLHECLWSLGMTVFVMILSKMSTDGYTSYQIASQFTRFGFIFIMAVSSSASVTIGMLLGRKDIDKALAYEKKYSLIQIFISTSVAILIAVGTYLFVDLFKVGEAIQREAILVGISLCIFMPINAYNGMQAAGILRAGGDTKVPVFFELAGIYFINVPLLYLLLKFSNLSVPVIIFCASTGSILTTVLLHRRVKTKKWAKNIISDENAITTEAVTISE